MLSVKLDTGFNIEVHFPISPFHRRMFAWVLDTLLMLIYGIVTSKLITAAPGNKAAEKEWLWVLAGIPVLIYYPLMEILTNGQTVGKKLLGIRVITLEGGQATASQYLLRWLFRTIDFPVWIFFAIFTGALPWYCSVLTFSGIGCVIMTDKSQRIGDIIAGTIMIYTRSKTSWQDTVFTEVEAGYKPRFPEVMKLSDRDLNSLKGFIDTMKKKNNHDLAFRIAERIKSKLAIQADQEPMDFLETLLKDYNFYTAS
ncbi:MAG: RDD family protein [Puia sp.]